LLLGLFFIAVGISMDLSVLVGRPLLLLAIVMGLVAIKAIILYLLGRWWGLINQAAVRLGLVISQGGEFAFVLFSAGALAGVDRTSIREPAQRSPRSGASSSISGSHSLREAELQWARMTALLKIGDLDAVSVKGASRRPAPMRSRSPFA
jgi:Kef-type K+ transport system membrane component KefB